MKEQESGKTHPFAHLHNQLTSRVEELHLTGAKEHIHLSHQILASLHHLCYLTWCMCVAHHMACWKEWFHSSEWLSNWTTLSHSMVFIPVVKYVVELGGKKKKKEECWCQVTQRNYQRSISQTTGGVFSGIHLISVFIKSFEFSALLMELVKAIVFICMGDLTHLLDLKIVFLHPYCIGECRKWKCKRNHTLPKWHKLK